MLKSNVIVAAGKLKKDEGSDAGPAEKSSMDTFKLHIGCIDPLSKAIQSMKDCYEDLADEELKNMLMGCIEGISKIEEALLAKAGEALKTEIMSIRAKPEAGAAPDITALVDQISGKAPVAPAAAPAAAGQAPVTASVSTNGQKP